MKSKSYKLVLAGMFAALGIVLPQLFHLSLGIAAGQAFLPMHIPAILSGLILGGPYGAATGFISVFVSSLATGMPAMPRLPFMLLEVTAYGYAAGLFYKIIKTQNQIIKIFLALILAQIAGRLAYFLCLLICIYAFGIKSETISFTYFIASFISGIPGIIMQLLIVPPISALVKKMSL
ncbi:MAG: ECF transporter S component [Bacillota bacterium]|nr:ECF transporter S component [Bacillota bacterium]